MTIPSIPNSLFDDLETNAAKLFSHPTCACFLAVDAGIPTSAARFLLEYLCSEALLRRVELRAFVKQNTEWAAAVLPGPHEVKRLVEFNEDLVVFVATEAALSSRALLERMAPVVRQVALMLAIYDDVLFRDDRRLQWLFQASVAAFQGGLVSGNPADLDPIGKRMLALRPSLHPDTVKYLQELTRSQPGFASFELTRTTQLRTLYHLALASHRPPLTNEMIGTSSLAARQAVVEHLRVVVAEGLERTPGDRSAALDGVFAKGAHFAPAGQSLSPRVDGKEPLLRWLGKKKSSQPLIERVIAGLDPHKYSDEIARNLALTCGLNESAVETIIRSRILLRGRGSLAPMGF